VAYDACVRGYFHSSTQLGPLFGWIAGDHVTKVEIKTCQRWINDAGSNGGRRRGSWYIDRDAHEQLVGHGGLYLLVLRDGDDIIAWVIVPASELDRDLKWSENGGRRVARARHPWTAVFRLDHLPTEGGAA